MDKKDWLTEEEGSVLLTDISSHIGSMLGQFWSTRALSRLLPSALLAAMAISWCFAMKGTTRVSGTLWPWRSMEKELQRQSISFLPIARGGRRL